MGTYFYTTRDTGRHLGMVIGDNVSEQHYGVLGNVITLGARGGQKEMALGTRRVHNGLTLGTIGGY